MPHVSKEKKLLKTKTPELCYSCHEKDEFEGKVIHKPVKRGACLECHEAHSSDEKARLTVATPELCLECHTKIAKQPHVTQNFSGGGHPLGMPIEGKEPAKDPLRPGKKFDCLSCHEPHKSDYPMRTRLDTKDRQGFCQNCHKM